MNYNKLIIIFLLFIAFSNEQMIDTILDLKNNNYKFKFINIININTNINNFFNFYNNNVYTPSFLMLNYFM